MFSVCNLSGHPIVQDGVRVVFEAQIPNVDLANPSEVQALARQLAEQATPFVLAGVHIALPGMTALASHVLAYIHGICGHWPRIAWAARVDGKFMWSEDFVSDLHEVRTSAREGR